jgi:hypothetical protein
MLTRWRYWRRGGRHESLRKRNARWAMLVTRFLAKQPEVADELPEDFKIYVLPDNDPELREYNLELSKHARGNVVLFEVKMTKRDSQQILDVGECA